MRFYGDKEKADAVYKYVPSTATHAGTQGLIRA